jgi:hypothetical protein
LDLPGRQASRSADRGLTIEACSGADRATFSCSTKEGDLSSVITRKGFQKLQSKLKELREV